MAKSNNKIITNGSNPRGPQIDDESHNRLFSEIGPPETFMVNDKRIIMFDSKGNPFTRKVGF